MKFRKSFVTNSSSSSYIAVFAKIKDKEKAKKIIEKYNLEKFLLLKSQLKYMDIDDFSKDWCETYLLENEEKLDDIKNKAEYDDIFLYWKNFEDLFYDYDSDNFEFEDFSEEEKSIFNAVSEKNGFEVFGAGYGAGYNG